MDALSLDRTWQFKPDPGNTGIGENWFSREDIFSGDSQPIQVPSCWEEYLEDYEGVGWYATSLHVPADKAGDLARLRFAAANYRTQVWINGEAAGEHEGGYTPFEFRIDQFLQYGADNRIVVRIISPIITRDLSVDGLGPNDMPHWRGGLTAGIWQPVHLEFNKGAWIADAFYKPDLASGSFELDLVVRSVKGDKAVVEISLDDANGDTACSTKKELDLVPGVNTLAQTLQLENPLPWDCQNPHLYTAKASVSIDGMVVAESTQRIGLRAFTYENERFYLNGKRIFLRGGFWEGVYARHQSYPADRAVVRKEIELAKAAGLNLLRPWRRPVPPMILEEADAAGLLVIASPAVECMSCWPTITPETPRRIEYEIRQLVLRDRNHPCIIWWEMFNEVTRREIAELIPKMSLMARELDPTRLILDESGGWATGAHFYLPRSGDTKFLCEVHSYVRAPVSEANLQCYRELGNSDSVEGNTAIKKGAGIFMSEFGFGGLPEFRENCRLFREHGNPLLPAYRHHHKLLAALEESMEACGLNELFPDVDSFCRASQEIQARGNRQMLEALLANPNVSGYCIHAFTDGDWILGAGLIDHWQRPKAAYHAIAKANEVPSLLCFPNRRNLETGEAVTIDCVLRGEGAQLPESIAVTNGDKSLEINSADWSPGDNYRQLRFELPGSLLHAGRNTVRVSGPVSGGKIQHTAEIELYVLDNSLQIDTQGLVVYDPENEVIPWLQAKSCTFARLEDWTPDGTPACFLFVPEDVAAEEHLDLVGNALSHVAEGLGSAIFLEPPSNHESPAMLEKYEANGRARNGKNHLLGSGIFPFQLTARPSFAFWESSMHVVKPHPVFAGLPQGCLMDEPYHEVAPVESLYQLQSAESPACTITWFRPEVIETKAKKRTYLGGEDLWHGTDLAVMCHGEGSVILSTLILRRKVSRDPVAGRILQNLVNYATSLINKTTLPAVHEHNA